MGVSRNGGTPKKDCLFHGKSMQSMDDLGVPHGTAI
jgi:hypothetical protein